MYELTASEDNNTDYWRELDLLHVNDGTDLTEYLGSFGIKLGYQ